MRFPDREGKSYPMGATITATGVNFAVYSKRADYLELLLFEEDDSPQPCAVYTLDPDRNRTANYWHIFLEGCRPGQVYAFRSHGVNDPSSGMIFDGDKVLLDPYGRGIVGWQHYSRKAAGEKGSNVEKSLRSVVVDCDAYDWENDRKPCIPFSSTIIYELHVGGFTRNPNSGIRQEKRGTFAGLIEKIPYLKALGVTTIELMPVQAFDLSDAPHGLTNYWGYSPIGFFAPHMAYSSKKSAMGAINEFRDMVKACHANGLEVILDVVFNHTGENDQHGPMLSFKGFDNLTYYTLDERDYTYKNYSGCGNTLRAEHPVVGGLIIDSLRFWVQDMHVDGFRFDLASVLSRDIYGRPSDRPPVLWAIESDSIVASSKLIVEAWDPAGLYQVGWFVTRASRFAEWNGPFRDDVRKFVKGDTDSVARLGHRLSGSCDIYGYTARDPNRSINFLSSHDGFTLNDVVSYNHKHNEANLEGNCDGDNANYSWNCGVEGATCDQQIESLRLKQLKNLLSILFFAQGTPMLCMGDEVRRTTGGNNNPYCQNNEINWFDWSLLSKNRELLEFSCKLIKFSKSFAGHRQECVLEEQHRTFNNADAFEPLRLDTFRQWASVRWHGVSKGKPDIGVDSHSLAMEINDPQSGKHLYAIFNAYWQPLSFELPASPGGEHWHKVIDTARGYREDALELAEAPVVITSRITAEARSVVILTNSHTINSAKLGEDNSGAQTGSKRRDQRITWSALKKPGAP
jgi:glycogen operon protein